MTTEFKLPELGENIETGDVVSVLVSVGDTINKDDPVLELETDKATVEVPSSVGGKVEAIHVEEGDTVEVGQLILTTANGEDGAGPSAEPEPADEAASEEPAQEPEAEAEPEPEPEPSAKAESEPAASVETEFKLPDLGENIETGDVVSVLVSVGDKINENDPVLELETDKATVEVPSSVGGTIETVHVSEGDTVEVGQLILTLKSEAAAKDQAEPEDEAGPAAEPSPQPEAAEETPSPETPPEEEKEEEAADTSPAPAARSAEPKSETALVPAAPNSRRMAREIGVNVAEVTGTGPGGRITIDDVKRHAKETLSGDGAPAAAAAPQRRELSMPDFSQWGDIETEPVKGIRKATAEQMDLAWSTIPHVTNFDKADIAELEKLRKRFAGQVEEAGGKLTITAILLKVTAAALKKFPKFNASFDLGNKEIVYKKYYHIGVAVDTDRGLLVPVIRDVDRKNIEELAVELGQMSSKARDGKLTLEEMQGGTFTITNLGGIGGTNFSPIVNHPEVAILGVSRGGREPVYNKETDQFEPRLMLPLSLSYDHRLIDGADAARFLRWIVNALEDPFMMALQGW